MSEVNRTQDYTLDFEKEFVSDNTTHCPVSNYSLNLTGFESTLTGMLSINGTSIVVNSKYRGEASFSVFGSNKRGKGIDKTYKLNFTDLIPEVMEEKVNETESNTTKIEKVEIKDDGSIFIPDGASATQVEQLQKISSLLNEAPEFEKELIKEITVSVRIGADGVYDDDSAFLYTSPTVVDKEKDQISMDFVHPSLPSLRVKKNDDDSFYIKVDKSMLTKKDHNKEHQIQVKMGDASHKNVFEAEVKLQFLVFQLDTLLNGDPYCDKACEQVKAVELMKVAELMELAE